MTGSAGEQLFGGSFDAVLFDLDGVLTSTASLHQAAWKAMFDDFLEERAGRLDDSFVPFEANDYDNLVDGKPRFDGVRSFLNSRRIELAEGAIDDPPSSDSISGLGNRKQQIFLALLEFEGADALPGAAELVRAVTDRRMRTAVVSSSANAVAVLDTTGLGGIFDTVVDGLEARRLALAGKPAPDTFLEAASRLGVLPERAVVVEDALAGVAAGRAGGFGLVVGIGPEDSADALRGSGADIVVVEVRELLPD